ncbi:MAG TPA: division/cell wall cluster transcriptional repressor MraZ [Clostridiales bacterium]|jgi:MraZ protein|nr:division/cell wall cluster transcriptional repressor MraZ [Clostridiales bacterium]
MLIGGSTHTIDAKGRMFFPARFKEDLWENIIICRGIEKCLMLFSPAEWEIFSEKIRKQPFSISSKLQRYFFSTAAQCSVDAQGRLLLPQALREYAGLEKNVMVVGTQSRAEIWDIEEWEKSQLSNEDVKDIVDSIDF